MGKRGGQAYTYEEWLKLQELIHPSFRKEQQKEANLLYNIIRSSELYAGSDHAFFSDTKRGFSIVTYSADDKIDELGLLPSDTFGQEPVIRWISDGQVNDVYLNGMTLEEFCDVTEVGISMPKGGYVASKRMSRIFRDYRVQTFLPDNELKILYLERDSIQDAIWDGSGLINRKVLQRMQLAPLEEAIEELEKETLREENGEALLQLESVRRAREVKLAKLRDRHKKLSRELATCNRVEYTIVTEKGQDKGHAIVSDNLVNDDGQEVDFILLDSDTKKETTLEGREWLGINFVHGHDHMRLDSQSLIHMQEFFPPEFLSGCIEQEGELFIEALEKGTAGAAMKRIDKSEMAEDITGWPLREFIVCGGDVRWSPHLAKMMTNQHIKRIRQKASTNKINIPIPGGRYYVIPDRVGQRGGIDVEVARGEIKIDEQYGTAWVNAQDWLELEDSPSGQGLASIWGGADNDDALWIFPFEDYDGEKKVLAWRSPNLLGEYAIFKPSADTPELEFETTGGKISYPKADSRKLPPRIDHLPAIQSQIDPDSAGGVGEGQPYSVAAMAPAMERARQNAGAVGLFCNALMVEAGLYNGRPEELPAALDHVIDAAVKTGADLTLVKEWCLEHTKQILRQGVPIPKLLRRRLAHDRNRDPNELVPPIIETPKDSQHFLDIIERHVTSHIQTITERREAAEYAPPARLMEQVFIDDRQKYGDTLTAGAEFNQRYGYIQKVIRDEKRWTNEDDDRLSEQISTEIEQMDAETRLSQLRQFIYEEIFEARAREKRRVFAYRPKSSNDAALLTEEDNEAIIAQTDRKVEQTVQQGQVEKALLDNILEKRLWAAKHQKASWNEADHDRVRRLMLWEIAKYPPDARPAIVRAAMVSAYMNDNPNSDAAVWVPGPETEYGRLQGISDITLDALREAGLLEKVVETEDGVITYPETVTEQATYSSVGIKNAWFNWYQDYARKSDVAVPTDGSRKALAQAGTTRQKVMKLFKKAAFDYEDSQIMIQEKEDPTTDKRKLVAYTHDGIELGEVINQQKAAIGQIKIEFAFARSGNLRIAFCAKQENKGDHNASDN